MKNSKLLFNLWLCVTFLLCSQNLKAQTVVIPDAEFVSFLQDNYPACMSGNLMDTTCADIVNEWFLDIDQTYLISNLSGLEYFDNLNEFNMESNNIITSIPHLPMDLSKLNMRYCSQLTTVTNLPSTLWILLLDGNNLTGLPPLPNGLQVYERNNMPSLPIETSLPPNLEKYSIINCNAINLPPLPITLDHLNIDDNLGVTIPTVLPSLDHLSIQNLNLNDLPVLPSFLTALYAGGNNFSDVSSLPAYLDTLVLSNCPNVTSIQNLSNNLEVLKANNCNITSIDYLPNNIFTLLLQNNNLNSLPNFPTYCDTANLENNNLEYLPKLPNVMHSLKLSNNSINCLPKLPDGSYELTLDNNPFTCVTNHVSAMTATFQAYPVCAQNDPINNPFGCFGGQGVEGYAFLDVDTNCFYQFTDPFLKNVPFRVHDSLGNFVSTVATSEIGRYYFPLNVGQYNVMVDTVNKPYIVDCQYPGADSTITLSSGNLTANDVNFSLKCNSGFDVGTKSVQPRGMVFPGQIHELHVWTGGILDYYNLSCSGGMSGTVKITVDGPVSYQGIPAGSLTPVISGNSYIYSIVDFDSVDFYNDFKLEFSTDTTAVAGDSVCVNVLVTPTNGDSDTLNNDFSICYDVLNSYDPNNKLVYPKKVAPSYVDYITYTINFQNTGNAPAINIRLEDTLSGFLDFSSFEVIGYSHPMHFNLTHDKLNVYFPNIMLVDSTTSEPDSKGYFTYRIKPNGYAVIGDQIENTAHIFFDFNPAIVTNTAVTEVGLYQSGFEEFEQIDMTIYPNPSSNEFNIRINENILEVQVFNQQGQLVAFDFDADFNQLDLMDNEKGIYFLHVVLEDHTITKKLIKK